MNNDYIPLDWDTKGSIIKVIGVGGGGNNAVNNMYRMGIEGVEFVVCNTDGQALLSSPIPTKVQLGSMLTRGRGAGCNPEQGKQAARESETEIKDLLSDHTEMVFITAGMGGGTGTGAAPVIAKIAHDLGLLTVGIVTLPFRDEGRDFMARAREGIHEMQRYVDSLLVIDNQRLYEIHGELPIIKAFSKVDDVLTTAAKGIAEIITRHGYINVDFADVRRVMEKSGVAMMGSGAASGEGRALAAVEAALSSPLLNNSDISGAKNVLVNITASDNVLMSELNQIMDVVQERTGGDPEFIKRGVVFDNTLGDAINVTVVATGFGVQSIPEMIVHQSTGERVILKDALLDDMEDYLPEKKNGRNTDETFEIKDNKKVFVVDDEPVQVSMPVAAPAPVHTVAPAPAPAPSPAVTPHPRTRPALILEKNDDITKLEDVPAYLRRNLYVNNPENTADDVPLTTTKITQNVAGGHQLKRDNAYLNQSLD